MKILFLDIDGVLNSKRTDIVYGTERVIENLDPIAVGLIHDVVQETGCIICLSSDWRLSNDYMKLGKELHLPIMFETTHEELECRGDEIKFVVDGIKPEKYAILDDIGNIQARLLPEQRDVLVKVENDNGVSYRNYLDLIEILK